MSTTTYDYVDLFAGPGGWDLAASRLGLSGLGIEWDTAACSTRWWAGLDTLQADVSALDPTRYPAKIFIASPPCQTFSPAGKGKGRKIFDDLREAADRIVAGEDGSAFVWDTLDTRSRLTLEPLRWIFSMLRNGTPYEYIALEQVTTVLPLWEYFADHLRDNGYTVQTTILNAEQYGVPQARRRAVLVARRGAPVSLPTPTHSKYYRHAPGRLDAGVLPYVTLSQAILGFAEIDQAVPGDTSWVYRRPSPTIVGSFSPEIVAAPGYRKPGDGPRQKAPGSIRITLEQAAILQSFPRKYPWKGSKTKQWEQVGNAVPPRMAEAILSALIS